MQEQITTRSNSDVLSSIRWDEPGRLDTLLGTVRPEVARALDRAAAGSEVGFEDALLLARTTGLEAEALVLVAHRMRRERVGDTITYVVNRNINFNIVCFVGCRFCAFSRSPRETDAYFHSFDEIARRQVAKWALKTRCCLHEPPDWKPKRWSL